MGQHYSSFILTFKNFDCRKDDPLFVKNWLRQNLPLITLGTEGDTSIMDLQELEEVEKKFSIDKFYKRQIKFSDAKDKGLSVLFWGNSMYLFYPKEIYNDQIICNLIPMNKRLVDDNYFEHFPKNFKMNMLLIYFKNQVIDSNSQKFLAKWFDKNRKFITSKTIFFDNEIIDDVIGDLKGDGGELFSPYSHKIHGKGFYVFFRHNYVMIVNSDVYPYWFYEYRDYTKEDFPNYKFKISKDVTISANFPF